MLFRRKDGSENGSLLLHTDLIKHLVTFVQNEPLDITEPKLLLTHQSIQPARGTDYYMRNGVLVREDLNVLGHLRSTVEDRCLDVRHILAEPRILILDLVGQLSGVAHHQDRCLAFDGFDLLQRSQDEDCCFTETRFRLAKNVGSQDCLWNAYLLNCFTG